SAPVNPVELIFLRIVNDGEKIAADSVGDRFHQPESCVCGNRGIDGAPTAFQNLYTDLGCRGDTRANHSMPAQHLGSCRKSFAGDAIDLSERRSGKYQTERSEDESTHPRTLW